MCRFCRGGVSSSGVAMKPLTNGRNEGARLGFCQFRQGFVSELFDETSGTYPLISLLLLSFSLYFINTSEGIELSPNFNLCWRKKRQ